MLSLLPSLVAGLIIGAILGSFIEVWAERSINGQSLWSHSLCLKCKHRLGWLDLIPLGSFLWLKGRCRYCHRPIPRPNLTTEVASGLLTGLLFVQTVPDLTIFAVFGWSQAVQLAELLLRLFILTVLMTIFLTDWRTGLIPDRVTRPATVLGLVFILILTVLRVVDFQQLFTSSPLAKFLVAPYSGYYNQQLLQIWLVPVWSVVAGAIVAIFFASLIFATRGRGMGWGDVKYGLFLGLVLGLDQAVVAVFLAFLFGAILAVGLLIAGRKRFGQTIPFGPFLSLGGLVALLWGQQIIQWYLSVSF